ncbi:MAG: hypothetical protein KDI45_04425 [Candidatus Accumulibacter sp.]|nr:hypothetical protein [Accumulibacter sp.]
MRRASLETSRSKSGGGAGVAAVNPIFRDWSAAARAHDFARDEPPSSVFKLLDVGSKAPAMPAIISLILWASQKGVHGLIGARAKLGPSRGRYRWQRVGEKVWSGIIAALFQGARGHFGGAGASHLRHLAGSQPIECIRRPEQAPVR